MRAVVLVLVAACGRIGFDPLGGGGDAAMGDYNTTRPNYVFVTSTATAAGGFGGLAGADAICRQAALGAGLEDEYVAWLSTSTVDAIDRVGAARGWVRLDELPFTDTVADLVAGNIWYPPSIDDKRANIISVVATNTYWDGRNVDGALNCADWTDAQAMGSYATGYSRGTARAFTYRFEISRPCTDPMPIYCFGIGHQFAVAPPATTTGKLLFVSSPWAVGGGTAAADAHCMQEATAAGRPGTFQAILSANTVPASSRFTATAGPVVRADGRLVAATVGALLQGQLELSPSLSIDGSLAATHAWAGARSPAMVENTSDCGGWTDNSATIAAWVGQTAFAGRGWFGLDGRGYGTTSFCDGATPLYCLEL
jgi:hypothetical protein